MRDHMKKEKLLLITDAWHPQVNGVVTYYSNLIPRLEEKGISVTVVHPGLFWSIPTPTYPDIRLSLFPRRKISRIFEEVQPTFVHIATEGPLGWSARSVCLRKQIPFTTMHSSNFDVYIAMRAPVLSSVMQNVVRSRLQKFHDSSACVMVATRALQKKMEGWGIHRVGISPMAVDMSLFCSLEKKANDNREPIFAYIGRLAPEKNVEEFLRSVLPGKKMAIGDGPSRMGFERRFPDVTFVGMKRGGELVRVLSDVTVSVFPSRTDTFGLVILESLACGIPVAAHPVMGPQDIISDGVDGVLREDLREAALACLSLDRSACRKKAETYSWENARQAFIQNLVPVLTQK